MARIRKNGIDYFPMDTDFMNHRVVRRIMKREGDRTLGILVSLFSCIYAGEGYYVVADDTFYDDLSASFYDSTPDDVRRIVEAAVEGGLFDAALYARNRTLTSADIQRQYLFITKRRKNVSLRPDICLLTPDERRSPSAEASADMYASEAENATSVTQSIAKHSKGKQSKENTSLTSPAGEEKGEAGEDTGAESTHEEEGRRKRKTVTQTDIDRLTPPADGLKRNYEGLRENLRLFKIPPAEQYAIIRKSNFGLIGHSVWKGLLTLRECGGRIKLPGRYLLSLQ